RHPPMVVAAADAAPLGPVVAIDKAKAAAGAEAARAQQHDNQAAQVFAPSNDSAAAPPAAPAAQPAAPAPAPAPQAAQNSAPADATAPTDVASIAPSGAAADADAATAAGAKYDPAAHRDPFRPPTMSSVVADTGAPKTPLEGYEIGQLKLVGIVRNSAG